MLKQINPRDNEQDDDSIRLSSPPPSDNAPMPDSKKAMMHKVRSLDSVRLGGSWIVLSSPSAGAGSQRQQRQQRQQEEEPNGAPRVPSPPPLPPPSDHTTSPLSPSCVASKFSRALNKERIMLLRRRLSRGQLGLLPPLPLSSDDDSDEMDCKSVKGETFLNAEHGSCGDLLAAAQPEGPLASISRAASTSTLQTGVAADAGSVAAEEPLMNIMSLLFGGQPGEQQPRGWTVGYFSVLILLLVTLTNFALHIVHAQMHRLDSPYYYDALSTEVIVPPFRYKTAQLSERDVARRPRFSLGSAAIGSVTSALSPILPFTGGVDLRRKEHWSLVDDDYDGWWTDALSSITSRARGLFGIITTPVFGVGETSASVSSIGSTAPRGGAQDVAGSGGSKSNDAPTVAGRHRKKRSRNADSNRRAILGAVEPFVSSDKIAELTLADVSTVFQYALVRNKGDFDEEEFLRNSTMNDRIKMVISAMDDAVSKSRGDGVSPSLFGPNTESEKHHYGHVDALQFCAAMRIFAEWRILRLVPDGYKGYAVGMGLGHKDVVQNVAKMENAVHTYIEEQREIIAMQETWNEHSCVGGNGGSCHEAGFPKGGGDPDKADNSTSPSAPSRPQPVLRSPTLRQLLQHEIDTDIHPTSKLPRLKEKSAGMGLLWVRRQLHYQTTLFANIIQVPSVFPTSNAAVSAAYSEVYGQYHGWAVQKIFNYSFQAAPEAEVICRFMNPHYLREVIDEAQRIPVNEKGEPLEEGEDSMLEMDNSSEMATSTSSETLDDALESNGSDQNGSIDADDSLFLTSSSVEDGNGGSEDNSFSETVHEQVTGNGRTKAELSINITQMSLKETQLDDGSIPNDSNDDLPWWVQFGTHIASEWDKLGKQIGGEWDKFGSHLGNEWDKFALNVVKIFNQDDDAENGNDSFNPRRARRGAQSATDATVTLLKVGLIGDALDRFVTVRMTANTHSNIATYLSVAQPLLQDLAGLFREMNMDDPTRV